MKKYMSIVLLCIALSACMLLCSCGQFGGGREQIDNLLDKIYGTTEADTQAPESGATTQADTQAPIERYDFFANDMAQFVTLDKSLYQAPKANVGSDYLLTDEVFDQQIQSMLYKYATATNGTTQVKDQPIRYGDQAYIYYRGEVDGKEFEGGSNMSNSTPYKLGIGSGSFIPGFEEGLIGVVPADTSKEAPYPLHVTFPENYGGDLSGKDAIFYVVVEYVVQYDVPELTDKFVSETLKYTTEDELPEKEGALVEHYLDALRESMEDSMKESAEASAYAMVMEELLGKLTFTNCPQNEIDYYYDYYINEFEYYYSYYSYMYGYNSFDEFAVDYMGLDKGADWKSALTENCTKMVKSCILVHAIAENEGIEQISDEEFDQELEEMVEYYDGKYTTEQLIEQVGEDAIRDSILSAKVQELIMERTTITYD